MKTAIVLLILLFLAACAQSEKATPYKFGAILHLTGTQAFYGEFSKIGIDLAIEDINNAGGINGRPVKIIYEDSASDKQKAATAAQKLINVDNADAMISITPFVGAVLAPIAEENKVPFIHIGSVNSYVVNKTYVFKDYPDVANICELLMHQIIKDGHEKVALFGINAESAQFCKEGALRVGNLTAYELYTPGDADFSTQFTKIKDSGSTALLFYALSDDCPNAYKKLRELNLKEQLYLVIQSFTCGNDANTKANADLLQNAYGADIAIDDENPDFISFKQRVEARGGTPHLIGSVQMYDITREMAQAMQGCNDSDCTVKNLRNLNYKGPSGQVSYNGKQISQRDVMLVKYENGTWRRAE